MRDESKKEQDWIGNENSVFKQLGASNHTSEEREEHDYYATDPMAVDKLLDHEPLENMLWEPACGEGHISKRLIEHGHHVDSTDLIFRNYGRGGGQLPRTESILSRKYYYKSSVSIRNRIHTKGFGIDRKRSSCVYVLETNYFRGAGTLQ